MTYGEYSTQVVQLYNSVWRFAKLGPAQIGTMTDHGPWFEALSSHDLDDVLAALFELAADADRPPSLAIVAKGATDVRRERVLKERSEQRRALPAIEPGKDRLVAYFEAMPEDRRTHFLEQAQRAFAGITKPSTKAPPGPESPIVQRYAAWLGERGGTPITQAPADQTSRCRCGAVIFGHPFDPDDQCRNCAAGHDRPERTVPAVVGIGTDLGPCACGGMIQRIDSNPVTGKCDACFCEYAQ